MTAKGRPGRNAPDLPFVHSFQRHGYFIMPHIGHFRKERGTSKPHSSSNSPFVKTSSVAPFAATSPSCQDRLKIPQNNRLKIPQ